MKQITCPAIVCIPWYRIKLPGCFNGTSVDPTLPIYWADVPTQVSIAQWPLLPFFPEDTHHRRWLISEIIDVLLSASEPVIVFASEKLSTEIKDELKDSSLVYDNEPFDFSIYHSKYDSKPSNIDRIYFQQPIGDEKLRLFPCNTPFQFPAVEYFRKS